MIVTRGIGRGSNGSLVAGGLTRRTLQALISYEFYTLAPRRIFKATASALSGMKSWIPPNGSTK